MTEVAQHEAPAPPDLTNQEDQVISIDQAPGLDEGGFEDQFDNPLDDQEFDDAGDYELSEEEQNRQYAEKMAMRAAVNPENLNIGRSDELNREYIQTTLDANPGNETAVAVYFEEMTWSVLAENLDLFHEKNLKEVTDYIMQTEDFGKLAYSVDKLPWVDTKALGEKLIQHHNVYTLCENLEKFPDADQKLVVSKLFEENVHYLLIDNLDKFTDVDHSYIVSELVKRGEARMLLAGLDKFKNIDRGDSLVSELLAMGVSDNTLVSKLYLFRDLSDDCLNLLSDGVGFKVRNFPTESRSEQYAWYADHHYGELSPGFNKQAVGKLIASRIENGLEEGLHDATQWLSTFNLPPEGYSLRVIDEQRAAGNTDPTNILEKARCRYFDEGLEEQLLANLMHSSAELRARLNLPTKDAKVQQTFYNEKYRMIYTTMLPLLKDPNFSPSMVQSAVEEKADDYYDQYIANHHTKNLAERVPRAVFKDILRHELIILTTMPDNEVSVTELVGQLQAIGTDRQAYFNECQGWLLRHAQMPYHKLTQTWEDRYMALAYGVNDSVGNILKWQKENAFTITLNQLDTEGKLPASITKEELSSEKWQPWWQELLRRLSARDTIEAIAEAKLWLMQARNWTETHDQPKLLPAEVVEVEYKNEAKPYRFEVLAADDPRGFTIGEDTGCCMTIKGASNSCIKEGYRNPNAGFVALYEPTGQIVAQSFFFVKPESPGVLVLDNIESNEGRDFDKVTELYKKALEQYLATHREANIQQVNVGAGYTDVDLSKYPVVKSVKPFDHVYSDAHTQHRLI